MYNPECRPTSRILPNGRIVPTTEGLKHSQSTKTVIAEKAKRRPKPPELIAKQSTVWLKVKPLRERLALSSEIAEITGFTKKQVKNAISRNGSRPELNRIPELTFEQVVELKRKAGKSKKPRNPKDRPFLTQDDKNSLIFARKLLEEGLITSDLSYWTNVNELYKNSGRTLPDNFSQKLRLEILLRGLIELKKGSPEILIKYYKLGRAIDGQWFKEDFLEEEGFVKANALTTWADGEDAKGFFRLNGNGIKERRVEFNEGSFVNVTSMLVIKKLIHNGVINGNGNGKKSPKQSWSDEQQKREA